MEADARARSRGDPLLGGLVAERFGLVHVIGSPSGSSAVYEAVDLADGSPCVVKLRRAGADLGAASLAREVWFLACVGDRAGVRLRGHGVCSSRGCTTPSNSEPVITFLARDAARGAALEALAPLPPARAAATVASVCDAVARLHEVGVVHADLTLAHAFVDEETARAALIDLGAAVLEGQPLLEGTPAYRAPELAGGAPASFRADVFALGRMLHRVLSGPRASFAEPLPPSTPERLRAALEAACAVDPEARPKHAAELGRALREV